METSVVGNEMRREHEYARTLFVLHYLQTLV
jgi:hypothetical protein